MCVCLLLLDHHLYGLIIHDGVTIFIFKVYECNGLLYVSLEFHGMSHEGISVYDGGRAGRDDKGVNFLYNIEFCKHAEKFPRFMARHYLFN